MNTVQKLPQELINQIAAGEVIERPSSIVKELVDNAIDAKATVIKIRIEEGGLKLVEISDNGIGIRKDDLSKVFDAHTTSKIEKLEDLNHVLTMGFRGEALSTIVAISNVKAISKHSDDDYGYEISFDGITPLPVTKSAKEQGTTITVANIFHNVPARRKFLKTPETEYRKILEILYPFFLQYNQIHFILHKDGKEVLNLPASGTDIDSINLDRAMKVLKADYISRMFKFTSQGAGMTIFGYSGHPKDNFEKVKDQYIFVNRRPIWDFGIAKAVKSAYSRFIPHTQKVPFIISIEIDSSLIDVNVHPRKEEIRFENPYRVYSTVESAIMHALENLVRTENTPSEPNSFDTSYNTNEGLSDRGTKSYMGASMFGASGAGSNTRDIRFNKPQKEYTIQQSLEFSKEVLEQSTSEIKPSSYVDVNKVFQIFNKYIVIDNNDELIMIDQHAAAERINFEKLEDSIENKNMDIQNLLIPTEIDMSDVEISYINENLSFFESLGFKILVKENTIDVTAIPSIFAGEDIQKLLRSIFDISEEQRDIKKSFENAKQNILATLACHGSIRKGQSLTPYEGMRLYQDLLKCKNTYSCPHGRPIIWKQKLTDIDTNFYRTY